MSINNNRTKLFFYSNVDNFIGVNASLLDGYFRTNVCCWPDDFVLILYVTSVSIMSRKGLIFDKQWKT